jgi:hypothetical protein
MMAVSVIAGSQLVSLVSVGCVGGGGGGGEGFIVMECESVNYYWVIMEGVISNGVKWSCRCIGLAIARSKGSCVDWILTLLDVVVFLAMGLRWQ